MLDWMPIVSTGLVALIIILAFLLVLKDFHIIKNKTMGHESGYLKNTVTISIVSRILLLAVMVFIVKFFHEGITFFDFKRVWLVFTNHGIEQPWQYMLANNILFVISCVALYLFISRRWSQESGILAVSVLCIMPTTIINAMPGLSSLVLLFEILFVWMYYEKRWIPAFVFGAVAIGLDHRVAWLLCFTLLSQLFLYLEALKKVNRPSAQEIESKVKTEIQVEIEDKLSRIEAEIEGEAKGEDREENIKEQPVSAAESHYDGRKGKKELIVSLIFILMCFIGLFFSFQSDILPLGFKNALDFSMPSQTAYRTIFIVNILPQIIILVIGCYAFFSLIGKNEFYMGLLVLLSVCVGLFTYRNGVFLEFAVPAALAATKKSLKPWATVLLVFSLGIIACLGMFMVK